LTFEHAATVRPDSAAYNKHAAVLVKGPTATQNSLLIPQSVTKTIVSILTAPNHRGMARLSGPEWPGKYGIIYLSKLVTKLC